MEDTTPKPATSASPVTITINGLRGQTIAFTSPKTAPLSSIHTTLESRAPWFSNSTYILTTTSRRLVPNTPSQTLSTLLSSKNDTFVPLRLTIPLCGGKGGFGSILRAQGGRMSSRKKQNGEQNGSSRNLDGRRLRTVAEAKALAEYLAAKPDLEKRERDEKRRRWEDIVASTERKREELGKGERQARLDGRWVEEKEEVERKSREAVEKMLAAAAAQEGSSEEDDVVAPAGEGSSKGKAAVQPKAMFGWEDEDDEFMSDSEEEEEVEVEDVQVVVEGKGKGKAV